MATPPPPQQCTAPLFMYIGHVRGQRQHNAVCSALNARHPGAINWPGLGGPPPTIYLRPYGVGLASFTLCYTEMSYLSSQSPAIINSSGNLYSRLPCATGRTRRLGPAGQAERRSTWVTLERVQPQDPQISTATLNPFYHIIQLYVQPDLVDPNFYPIKMCSVCKKNADYWIIVNRKW